MMDAKRDNQIYIISVFGEQLIAFNCIAGFNIESNKQSCSLIIIPENPSRVYDDNGEDVEILIQGKPLQADPNLGIKVIPYESTQDALFKLFDLIVCRYGFTGSPDYEVLRNLETGGNIFTSKTQDEELIHIYEIEHLLAQWNRFKEKPYPNPNTILKCIEQDIQDFMYNRHGCVRQRKIRQYKKS